MNEADRRPFIQGCGKEIIAATSIDPMNLDIHYHKGSRVVFPAKHDQTASLEGGLEAPTDQDYCCMWQNGSGIKNTLSVVLRRG